ncbi:MAG TPA: hypothetical protein VGN07_20230 [Steroidobacteraceae bacterium]|jgi:hypothetical protein
MEFLLLWVDELDDAVGALRHLAPQILGFLTAVALFVATGAAVIMAPQITLTVGAIVFSASLLEVARRRRTRIAAQRDSR